MYRLSKDTPISELYHSAMRKGYQKADHKYIYREWKNGKWVYYYEDGTNVKDLPKGMNYKTQKQVEIEQKATEAAKTAQAEKAKEKENRETLVKTKIGNAVDVGRKAFDKIDAFLSIKISDIPYLIERAYRDKD